MNEYPEHERLHKVKDKSQIIGEFLDWLNESGYHIAEYIDPEDEHLTPVGYTINDLLARYFDIDLDLIEKEKRQMLKEIRLTRREM